VAARDEGTANDKGGYAAAGEAEEGVTQASAAGAAEPVAAASATNVPQERQANERRVEVNDKRPIQRQKENERPKLNPVRNKMGS